ncbi:MerR family transcriptional regulator [Prauserella oleivorans]|uniref:MerR family transcriptional regulator n=1 Tax=Prauserella oleivorans TaxID=1478153 RepID=A0ABW5WDQ3_9PSEU
MSYSIAQVARRTGLSVDTLRYYERIRLLDPPARDQAGRRVYSDADLAWLRFLTRLRTAGMPIRRMREYARLRGRGPASAPRRKAMLVEQRGVVTRRIAELRDCLEVLDHEIGAHDEVSGTGYRQGAGRLGA